MPMGMDVQMPDYRSKSGDDGARRIAEVICSSKFQVGALESGLELSSVGAATRTLLSQVNVER